MFEPVDWHGMFVPKIPILEIVIRGTLIYLGLFLLMRVILKRESGTLGISDMLLVVLIADASQSGMTADYTSVTEGLILVVTIIVWSYVLNWLGFHFPMFQRLLKPGKLLLVKNGVMLRENMRKELITHSELMSEVRANGIADLSRIREAYMEPSGRISIICEDEKPTRAAEEKKVL
ncbi:DUF421 domain-containing protein [Hymenobacter latericus]|uniref:DUF421 domain-containing protein n=1 Tax=Hymenobacter sp. YIM 151858-1 TaxID=2987688 RepID=UPI0022265377|nr:YetF domain-containing protein [Hymenobacter sp. YIM 151858-1]UYZ59744.1 DUF421 domain-containing protein [Hymenobacter sp. YIM 151858-1]